jgi:hypothetical protein
MSFSDNEHDLSAVSGIESSLMDWLWPGWFALGKLALLDGDPGMGKSLVALDLCARLSAGQPFPDGSNGLGPGCSIVLNGEDGGEDTIKPRLAALGADLDRVFVLRPRCETGSPLFFPTGLDQLSSAVKKVSAKLVVIDPIMAFLDPSIASSSDQSIRRVLLPLARLAGFHRCVILLIRHLNKTYRSCAMYRGGGSIGLIGACRSACLVTADPADAKRRVLAQIKNNLAPRQASVGYELVARVQGLPVVSWLGPKPWTADELLARQLPIRVTPRDRARDFLSAFLKAGPRTSRDIWTAALAQRLTDGTLRRAKTELEICSRRVWAAGRRVSYWMLPGQQLPADVGTAVAAMDAPAANALPVATANPVTVDDDSGDLEAWLAPLREKYPPLTPLDDL